MLHISRFPVLPSAALSLCQTKLATPLLLLPSALKLWVSFGFFSLSRIRCTQGVVSWSEAKVWQCLRLHGSVATKVKAAPEHSKCCNGKKKVIICSQNMVNHASAQHRGIAADGEFSDDHVLLNDINGWRCKIRQHNIPTRLAKLFWLDMMINAW